MNDAAVEKSVKSAETKVDAKASVTAKKTIKVFPIYSPMHDPHTGVTYGETGVEVLALDPWVKCQVDAGKLRVE